MQSPVSEQAVEPTPLAKQDSVVFDDGQSMIEEPPAPQVGDAGVDFGEELDDDDDENLGRPAQDFMFRFSGDPGVDPIERSPHAGSSIHYNHEATVKKLRDFRFGRRKYWDDEKQSMWEEMLENPEDNIVPPKPDSGQLVGADYLAPNQSIAQMLCVRDAFRECGRVNLEKRLEALKGLQPGTAEYRQAYTEWQIGAFERFNDTWDNAHPSMLPDAVNQSKEWFAKLDSPWPERTTNYENLGTFGNMIATLTDSFDKMFNFGVHTRLGVVTRVVALSGLRYVISMRPSLLVCGERSTSKTFTFQQIEKISPPGLFSTTSYMTVKSMTNDMDRNLKVVCIDEGTGALIGEDHQDGDSERAAIVKTMLTNKQLISEMLCVENGRRTLVQSISSRIGTFLIATNNELASEDSPILARYIVWPVETVTSKQFDAIENKAYCFTEQRNEVEESELTKKMQLDSYYVMWVEMAIACNCIRDVDLDPCVIYYQQFNGYMAEMEKGLEDTKRKVHSFEFVRTLTVMHAVYIVMGSELTRDDRYDPLTGEPVPFNRVRNKLLREIERLLCVSVDAAVFGFSLLGLLWTDTQVPKICNTIRDLVKVDNIDGKGKKAFDLDRSSIEVHPLDNGLQQDKDAAMYPILQKRIEARVRLTAKDEAYDEGTMSREQELMALQAAGTVPPSHQLMAAPAASSVASTNDKVGNSSGDKSWLESRFLKFIETRVKIPLRTIVDGEQRVSIDAMYIEFTRNMGRQNLDSVAKQLKGAQRGSKMSYKMIKRTIKAMENREIESRIYSFDIRNNCIYLPEKYKNKRRSVQAIIAVDGDSRDIAHVQNLARGSKRYFIATELLAKTQSQEDVVEAAIKSMCYDVTLRRTVLTGLVSVAPAYRTKYRTKDGRIVERVFGEDRSFDSAFRAVEMYPKPERSFSAINYNSLTDTADINLSSQAFGVKSTPEVVALRREKELFHRTTIINVNLDPDMVYAEKRGAYCGFPEEEAPRGVVLAVDAAIRDIRDQDQQCYFITGLLYPQNKVSNLQVKNHRLSVASSRPSTMNQATITGQGSFHREKKINDKFIDMMARFGNPAQIEKYMWNGNRSSLPSVNPSAVSALQAAKRINVDLPESLLQRSFSESSDGTKPHQGMREVFARKRAAAPVPQQQQPRVTEQDLFGSPSVKSIGLKRALPAAMMDVEEARKRRRELQKRIMKPAYDPEMSQEDVDVVERDLNFIEQQKRNGVRIHAVPETQADALGTGVVGSSSMVEDAPPPQRKRVMLFN